MSVFINRAHAARVVVLLVVVVLAVTVSQLTSPSGAPTTADRAFAEQERLPGATLAPSATPLPAPAEQASRSGRGRGKHHARGRHHSRHAGARRARTRSRHRARHSGADISWPQCPVRRRHGRRGEPLPGLGVRFVVIGLTAGRAYVPNPCLEAHLRWARSHHLPTAAYSFSAFPSRAELRRQRHHGPHGAAHGLGVLKAAGTAAARYNVGLMRRHGFLTPHVWLDIEPSSSHPWSRHRERNRAVVRGWIRGYRSAGYTVGFYSTPLLWRHILGSRYRPGLPEWRTAGPASSRAALRTCGTESFQGGHAVIAQWWTRHRDFDRLCAGTRSTTLAQYFHQW